MGTPIPGSLIRLSSFLARRPIPPSMGRAIHVLRSRRVRIAVNAVFVAGALTAAVLTALHFAHTGWPLHSADPTLVVTAGALFVAAFAFKAWGWQRLFPVGERPESLTLAAAGGAASVGGVALPGRFDEAIRIAVVRKLPGRRAGLGAIVVSLLVLGWIDSAALTPLASVAAAAADKGSVQAGFALLAGIGVVAAGAVVALPLLARTLLRRFRISQWMRDHCACARAASTAWVLVSVSWALRGTAVFVLLHALAVGASFPLALAFLCASAASAALPIAPAGAATQAGAGAAILIVSGIPKADALAFSVAAQAMVILAGAAVVTIAGLWHLAGRFRAPRAVAAAP